MIASSIPAQVVTSSRSVEHDHLALFVDFENVAKLGGRAICDLYRRLEEDDVITPARAYGDWGRFAKAKSCLAACGVRLIEMPAGLSGKNSADMQLTVDAMEAALLYPSLNTFVFVSGDRDFVPLARVLRRWGKQVWAFAPSDGASSLLKAVCDRFEVIQPAPSTTGTVPGSNAKVKQTVPRSPRNETNPTACATKLPEPIIGLVAWAHFAAQCDGTSAERSGKAQNDRPVMMSQLFRMMRKLSPGFSPASFVSSSKRTNIRFAEQLQALGILRITNNKAGDHLLVPTAKCEQIRASFPAPETLAASTSESRHSSSPRCEDGHTDRTHDEKPNTQDLRPTWDDDKDAAPEPVAVRLDREHVAVPAPRSLELRFKPR